MSKFVVLTKENFEKMLPDAELIDAPGNEYVYQLPVADNVAIRIFSSVDKATGETRDKGADAIRLVPWNTLNNWPLDKGVKVYRVEGKTTIKERLERAIQTLKEKEYNVVDWGYVRAVLAQFPHNNFAQSLQDSLTRYGQLTDRQLAYVLGDTNPKGYPTFEAQAKQKRADFAVSFVSDAPEIAKQEKDDPKPILEYESATAGNIEPVAGDETELIPTADYPDYQYPFEYFNPVQSLTFPHRNSDTNLVIAANTSAGKTICAELLMDATLNEGRRVIYLSPLKALTQEKYDDWQTRFAGRNISILTGDYTLSPDKQKELFKANIIVMTSEMCDSRTRRMHTEKNYWLNEVGLVIVDEAHILATERGHAVETGIMRFTRLNPHTRLCLLSATMPNVKELGKWCTNLNKKQTEVIFCTWRPVPLDLNVVGYAPVTNGNGRIDYQATQAVKRATALDIIASKPDEKFLVFVHDKGTGRQLVKEIADRLGEQAEFYNADLGREERYAIEQSFRDRENGLRIMVSTSATAWGVNLPARNVVIVGVHRGMQEVDDYDIIQMAGRAGRYGIDDEGHVYLIVPGEDIVLWHKRFARPRDIISKLKEPYILAFHVLAEINNRVIKYPDDAVAWYKRSLGYLQGIPFEIDDAERLFGELLAMDMIKHNSKDEAVVTGLGKVSAWLYFNPYDVYNWMQNFQYVFYEGMENDNVALAWAVGDVSSEYLGYIPKQIYNEIDELRWMLRERRIKADKAVHKVLAYLHCLNGDETRNPLLNALMRQCRYDIDRVIQAVKLIDNMYAKWGKDEMWETLPARVIYGIPAEMAELVKIPGVGGKTAKRLWDAGIKTIADVANAKPSKLRKVFRSPKTMKKVIEAAKAMTK